MNYEFRIKNNYFAEGYIYSSYETAGHTPGHLMSVNFHPINEGDKRTPLGCLRFWYLLQSDGTSFLKVGIRKLFRLM